MGIPYFIIKKGIDLYTRYLNNIKNTYYIKRIFN